jgi:hypothetical protein
MIPSGYKEDVVYSAVPTDGSGDLSFTRASNGTRVNSAGLVEVCPWNLVQQSETFNTTWSASNTVVTANQTTAPNGTTTADLVVDNANNTSHALTQSVTNLSVGLDYYYSIYVKNNNHTWVLLRHDNGGTFNYFNIATGVKGTNTQANSTIESVGNGWYKLTVPFNVTGSSSGPEFYLASADGTFTYAGTGTGVYIWGASYTLSAKPYFPTTDRLNVPRLTYQNGGGGCPSLLLEKQSTNISAQSENFNGWGTKINITTTANYATSPDGTTNASRLQFTGSGFMYGNTGFGQTSGTVYTLSCWAKRNGSGTQSVGFFVNGSGGVDSAWSLTSEYQRFTYTYTAGNSSTVGIGGASGADVSVWGWQFEASSYPTSYIPTTSASATRIADACFKTGISSLIGQTQGTMFVDLVITGTTGNNRFSISDGSNTNWIFIGTPEDGATRSSRFYIKTNGVVRVDTGTSSYFTIGQRYKLALAYKSGDWAVYANGSLLYSGTDSIGSVSSPLSAFDFFNHSGGTADCGEQINQAILFPTRLTNAELATLTTI